MKKKFVSAILLSLILSSAIFTWGCGTGNDAKPTITVAAASSLQTVLEDQIIPTFNKDHPNITVQGTFDSSGNLKTQIEQGADVDLFFSAAVKQMNSLATGGFVTKGSEVNLLENEIVLIAGSYLDVTKFTKFEDIINADTIALGDPESVPAGSYAKEALTNLRLWGNVQRKKVSIGTNVSQVLGWVSEGSAQVGIVYNSDALSMKGKVKIVAKAPDGSVSKCIYPVAVLAKSKQAEAANVFLEFLQSDKALNIFKAAGFKIHQ